VTRPYPSSLLITPVWRGSSPASYNRHLAVSRSVGEELWRLGRLVIETSKVIAMSVQFSRQGMTALPLPVPVSTASFARWLLETRGDPDKARVVAWLLKADDKRLLGFGFTPEDIALLRGLVRNWSGVYRHDAEAGRDEIGVCGRFRVAPRGIHFDDKKRVDSPITHVVPDGWNLTWMMMEMVMRTTFATPAIAGGRSRPRRSALIAALRTWWTAHLTRRSEREAILQLHAMSDRELRDIGLARSQIEGAVRGQLDQRPFARHYWPRSAGWTGSDRATSMTASKPRMRLAGRDRIAGTPEVVLAMAVEPRSPRCSSTTDTALHATCSLSAMPPYRP
jgi:uncharacterized protein YjiS (DUF1127 family)